MGEKIVWGLPVLCLPAASSVTPGRLAVYRGQNLPATAQPEIWPLVPGVALYPQQLAIIEKGGGKRFLAWVETRVGSGHVVYALSAYFPPEIIERILRGLAQLTADYPELGELPVFVELWYFDGRHEALCQGKMPVIELLREGCRAFELAEVRMLSRPPSFISVIKDTGLLL